jgi:hypothetical protein
MDSNNVQTLSSFLVRNEILREEKLDGITYFVIPVVMAVKDCVMNGLLYPDEELAKTASSWDGVPVTLNHPNAGKANSPESYEKYKVGMLFNSKYEEGKLKSEVWVDVEAIKKKDPTTYSMIKSNVMMDVSTGLYVEIEQSSGTQNGKEYNGIARNFRPEHLALLPNTTGACTQADGVGLFLNSENGDKVLSFIRNICKELGFSVTLNKAEKIDVEKELISYFTKNVKNIKKSDIIVKKVGTNYAKISIINNEMTVPYEIVDGVIRFDKVDELELDGRIPSNEDSKECIKNQKGTEQMDIQKFVDKLIENGLASEDQKAALLGMEMNAIVDAITPEKEAVAEEAEPEEVIEEKADVVEEVKEEVVEEVKTNALDDAMVQEALKLFNEKKEALIETIVTNENSEFTKDELKGRSLDELAKLSKLCVNAVADFSGRVVGVATHQDNKPSPLGAK